MSKAEHALDVVFSMVESVLLLAQCLQRTTMFFELVTEINSAGKHFYFSSFILYHLLLSWVTKGADVWKGITRKPQGLCCPQKWPRSHLI